MQTLQGKHINLRAIELEDLDILFEIENNEQFWEVSHTQTPFSKFILKQYIQNAHQDIYQAKQLRLVVEHRTSKTVVGMIDLFDFNPQHLRAGIGILIHPNHQKNGYASEALTLLINYSTTYLRLHQLYASVTEDNTNSIHLFQKHGFQQTGVRKDWILSKESYKNEILFQLIHE